MQKEIEFHGIVNDKKIIVAQNLKQLKRLASRYSNNDYRPIDTMRVMVHYINGCANIDIMHFIRINKIAPNSTIIRGSWK